MGSNPICFFSIAYHNIEAGQPRSNNYDQKITTSA